MSNGNKSKQIAGACFLGGTLVYTSMGHMAIEQLQVGDMVYSKEYETGEFTEKEILKISQSATYKLYNLTIGSETINVTEEHPFLVFEKGFLPAYNLVVGDLIVRYEENEFGENDICVAEITQIEKIYLEELIPVYNLIIEDFHTYFVTYHNFWVHNGNPCSGKIMNNKPKVDTNPIIDDVKNGKIVLETNKQKGNFGEMVMDEYMASKGYNRISLDKVNDLNQKIKPGIDGVYEHPKGGPPKYIICEAKYGSSTLSKTKDGLQMSEEWILGSDRLEKDVGNEMAKKILLEMALNPDNVQSNLIKVDSKGNVTISVLDENGEIVK